MLRLHLPRQYYRQGVRCRLPGTCPSVELIRSRTGRQCYRLLRALRVPQQHCIQHADERTREREVGHLWRQLLRSRQRRCSVLRQLPYSRCQMLVSWRRNSCRRQQHGVFHQQHLLQQPLPPTQQPGIEQRIGCLCRYRLKELFRRQHHG